MTTGFRSPRPNLIESEEGFSIEVIGRTGILYKEGDRRMSVDAELLAPGAPCGLAVWSKSIKRWKPPYETEEIDEAKRNAILENIRRAVRFKGDDIDIIG